MIETPHAYVLQRDNLRCVGPDSKEFLQGQLSQDIESLTDFSSAWSFLLNPNGKLCAWLRVRRISNEEYILDMEQGFGRLALDRLNRFKIRVKCDIETTQSEIIRILGEGANAIKENFVDSGSVADLEWSSLEGFDLIGPTATPPEGCTTGTGDQYDYVRITHAVPKMGSELTEGIIPAETNLVSKGVSFTKGCYTGQELVARLDSRGNNVAKHLRRLSSSDVFPRGSDITIEGKKVGSVTSAISSGSGTVGLGYVARSMEIPGTALIDGSSVQVTSASH